MIRNAHSPEQQTLKPLQEEFTVDDILITTILLIKISPTKEQEVYNELLRIPEVVDAHVVFGEYDLIAKIKTKNFTSLVQLVNENIETISGVIGTRVNFYPVGRK